MARVAMSGWVSGSCGAISPTVVPCALRPDWHAACDRHRRSIRAFATATLSLQRSCDATIRPFFPDLVVDKKPGADLRLQQENLGGVLEQTKYPELRQHGLAYNYATPGEIVITSATFDPTLAIIHRTRCSRRTGTPDLRDLRFPAAARCAGPYLSGRAGAPSVSRTRRSPAVQPAPDRRDPRGHTTAHRTNASAACSLHRSRRSLALWRFRKSWFCSICATQNRQNSARQPNQSASRHARSGAVR